MKTIFISIISFIFLTTSVYCQENKAVKERLEKKYGWACYHSSGKGWYSVMSDKKEGACDINGKELIPPEYDDVHVDYDDNYIKAKKNGATTIFSLSGKQIFHGEFDDISWWQMKDDGYCEVKKNGEVGLINKDGKLVVPCEYKDTYIDIEDKYIKATKNGATTIFNLSGKQLFHGEFDDVSWWQMEDGYCAVKKNGKYGTINKVGKIVVPCEYDEAPGYIDEDGLCKVRINKKTGLYDVKNSKLIVPCRYDCVASGYFPSGHGYVVIDNEKYGFVDNQGKEVVPCIYSFLTTQYTGAPYLSVVKGGKLPADASPVSNSPQCCVEDGLWGLLDLSGVEVMPFEYEYIYKVEDDIAVVCKGGKMTYEPGNSYMKNGKKLVNYHSNYNAGDSSLGFYNVKIKKSTDYIYHDGVFIGEGYIGCKNQKNKWGYLDAMTMEMIIPFEYDHASAFANGIAQVKKDGKASFLTDPRKGTKLQMANGGGHSIKVDENIPLTDKKQTESFAFIIANENYAHLSGADYAINDGKVFKEYCIKTFGMPENNVRYYEDATFGNFTNVIKRIKDIADVYEGEASIIVYYSGLGMTDASSKDKYILPTDANVDALNVTGVSVSELTAILNALKTKNTIVILDASFSGTNKTGQALTQNRGVAIASKPVKVEGNTVLCLGDDDSVSAYSSKDYAHSLFTYALLEKIQESKGKCSLGEAVNYATNWVKKESLRLYDKPQKPIVVSAGQNNIQNIKF